MGAQSRAGRLTLLLALAATLAACAGAGGSGDQSAPSEARAVGPLPAAETLDADLVMAPIGRDARGCVQYRMQSTRRPAVQAVFYRTAAGDFSTIKEEAACT